jgi:hypothetical protein
MPNSERGGSSEQHAKAGEQGHKNTTGSGSKESGSEGSTRGSSRKTTPRERWLGGGANEARLGLGAINKRALGLNRSRAGLVPIGSEREVAAEKGTKILGGRRANTGGSAFLRATLATTFSQAL